METKEYNIVTEKYFKKIISNQEKIIKPLEEIIKSIPIPEMIIKSDKVNIQIMEYVTNIINKEIKKHSFLNNFHVEIINHISGFILSFNNKKGSSDIKIDSIGFLIEDCLFFNEKKQFKLSAIVSKIEISFKNNNSNFFSQWNFSNDVFALYTYNSEEDFSATIPFYNGIYYDFNFSNENMCSEKAHIYSKAFFSLMIFSKYNLEETIQHLLTNVPFSKSEMDEVILKTDLLLDNNLINTVLFDVWSYNTK